MTEPKRPWWKRPRWFAVGMLWLVLGYLFTVGPVIYAVTRGWISATTASAYMWPYESAFFLADVVEDVYEGYVHWWEELAEDHNDAR